MQDDVTKKFEVEDKNKIITQKQAAVSFPTVSILGVPLFAGGMDDAVRLVIDACQASGDKKNRCISATGAHGIVIANHDSQHMSTLNNFYLNLCDGRPSVWIGRLKGAKTLSQVPGPDFFIEIMRQSATLPIRHYFCGGDLGVAEKLKHNCEQNFGNKNVVGAHSPPFRELSDLELRYLADEINLLAINIVWIGISTPKQERFAERLSQYTNVDFIITVGAAFDIHSGLASRPPPVVSKLGLECFYRVLKSPRRLFKRVVHFVVWYLWLHLCEFIKHIENRLGRKA